MNQENEIAFSSKCFICPFASESALVVINHCNEKHNLDIRKILCSKNGNPDQLDYIKIVNYLRSNSGNLSSNDWKSEKYLIPAIEEDPLLYFDVEEFLEQEKLVKDEKETTEQKLARVESELEEARVTIEQMKMHVRNWLGDDGKMPVPSISQEKAFEKDIDEDIDDEDIDDDEAENSCGEEAGSDYKSGIKREENTENNKDIVTKQRQLRSKNSNRRRRSRDKEERVAPVDSSYFFSYAGYSVHKDMLQDTARTEAYLNFVKKNKALFENKIVIDVGCGTGILSMFAVRYGGARKVFALEPSSMAFQAIDTIRENNIPDNAITVINAHAESREVSRILSDFGEKADIIISEWMGYFMLFENMLPSVIFARDKFMKATGFMAPSRADLYLEASDSQTAFNEYVGFWSDVYGFTMKKMKRRILMDAQIGQFQKEEIVSKNKITLLSMNLNTCPPPPAVIESDFEMTFTKDTKLTAFVGWFTTTFEGDCDIVLTTGPGEMKTHWQQSMLFLPEPIPVEAEKSYTCSSTISRLVNDHRSLDITIKFQNHSYTWALCRD